MLSNLHIENIAVIEKASIDFAGGFNVLTGETGAGKSIVIDSINAVLGERTSRELIRSGAKSARVAALFTGISDAVKKLLQEQGYDCEEDSSLLISREISETRSICRVNGRPATVSILREVGHSLINIHGQHANQSLLKPERHLGYLDSMGDYMPLLAEYRSAYRELCRIRDELGGISTDEAEKQRRMEVLRYQIRELSDAKPKAGEEKQLTTRKNQLLSAEEVEKAVERCREALNGTDESGGAVELVNEAAQAFDELGELYPDIDQISARLSDLSYELEDCAREIANLDLDTGVNPGELEEIESRLGTLYQLSSKYRCESDELPALLEQLQQEYSGIERSEDRLRELGEQFQAQKKTTVALAKKLSRARRENASVFAGRVMEELTFLDMPSVRFEVGVTLGKLTASGADTVEFLISANPGEPPRPLAKIASGGELSRTMLAIQNVLADKDDIDTLIFDEVDTGISGRAAQKVGIKLREAAKNRQIICVTHSSQIASQAHEHLLIEKTVRDGRTFTSILPLDLEGRRREIARIMSGDHITDLSLQTAGEMIRMASEKGSS